MILQGDVPVRYRYVGGPLDGEEYHRLPPLKKYSFAAMPYKNQGGVISSHFDGPYYLYILYDNETYGYCGIRSLEELLAMGAVNQDYIEAVEILTGRKYGSLL